MSELEEKNAVWKGGEGGGKPNNKVYKWEGMKGGVKEPLFLEPNFHCGGEGPEERRNEGGGRKRKGPHWKEKRGKRLEQCQKREMGLTLKKKKETEVILVGRAG